MPDQNTTTPPQNTPTTTTTPADSVATAPDPSVATATPTDETTAVAARINEAQNVLIALSSNPSVDEMAAAIGLSLFLDKLGKRATAIYSGSTPNALEFLKPEETFESTADTLQDFVIAISKEKADHLRYKLDGEFVKIFITPYKTRISEEDLEFSYGDFNVDLVLALDVANGIDLDAALREHGRIMHDAVIVNVTTGNPGKFGEIEWSDKAASSVSEMVAKLLYGMNTKVKIDKEEATAFLTGIVASTNCFSNAKTTSETMKISSKLMESGANQQLISKNITNDTENEVFSMIGQSNNPSAKKDQTKLDIKHGNEEVQAPATEVDTDITAKESALLDSLKAAEASLAQAGAEVTPDDTVSQQVEKVIQPLNAPDTTIPNEGSDKYGKMLEDALAELKENSPPMPDIGNPAAANTPQVTSEPEINGVPSINYMPMPGDEVLPPPPTPPISMDTPAEPTPPAEPVEPVEPITPATVTAAASAPPETPLGPQPAMQDQIYAPQAADPSAFKIPGM